MKNKTILIIILLFFTLIIGLLFMLNFYSNKENNVTEPITTQQQSNINQNNSVKLSDFINNLKAYFSGEKKEKVKLNKKNEQGEDYGYTVLAGGDNVEESNIIISNDSIKVIAVEEMPYEWNYQISDDGIVLSIEKFDVTYIDKVTFGATVNHSSTLFVAYAELLGITPKDALTFWHLAIRDINKKEINKDTTIIENEIFSITSEYILDNSYSCTIKINNRNMYKLKNLLEKEKSKDSPVTFVEY